MLIRIFNKLKYLVHKADECISTLLLKIKFSFYKIPYGDGLKVRGSVVLYINGHAEIGKKVRINSSFRSNPISPASHTSICIRGGVFSVGNESGISNTCFVCQKEIRIGNQVMIGAGCQFYDNDFHPLISEYRVGDKRDGSMINSKPIIVEDNVFIGANSIILKGTTIGKGAIIGAGSVVCGKIPPYEIWAGNPARYIKKTI